MIPNKCSLCLINSWVKTKSCPLISVINPNTLLLVMINWSSFGKLLISSPFGRRNHRHYEKMISNFNSKFWLIHMLQSWSLPQVTNRSRSTKQLQVKRSARLTAVKSLQPCACQATWGTWSQPQKKVSSTSGGSQRIFLVLSTKYVQTQSKWGRRCSVFRKSSLRKMRWQQITKNRSEGQVQVISHSLPNNSHKISQFNSTRAWMTRVQLNNLKRPKRSMIFWVKSPKRII